MKAYLAGDISWALWMKSAGELFRPEIVHCKTLVSGASLMPYGKLAIPSPSVNNAIPDN